MSAPVDPVYLRRTAETEAVRSLRTRVGIARERCLKRAECASSYDAGQLMLRATQIASAWQWAVATEERLEDVILMLSALNVAANVAERL